MKNFNVDWFSHNIESLENVVKDIKGTENLRGLEIGAFQGRSTCWFMDNVFTHPTSVLDVVDTFEGSVEHKIMGELNEILVLLYNIFINNVSEYGSRVVPYKISSCKFLRLQQTTNMYDFIYIDGDHRSWAVLEDAVLSWPLLKPGGILVFDDYGDHNLGNHQPDELPYIGIDAFLQAYKTQYDILLIGYQVAVRKK
jgi:predicted O-methyltransferase YrrM